MHQCTRNCKLNGVTLDADVTKEHKHIPGGAVLGSLTPNYWMCDLNPPPRFTAIHIRRLNTSPFLFFSFLLFRTGSNHAISDKRPDHMISPLKENKRKRVPVTLTCDQLFYAEVGLGGGGGVQPLAL